MSKRSGCDVGYKINNVLHKNGTVAGSIAWIQGSWI